ncbi:ISL3 family transposase [Streptomyces sp. NPDC000594]|uniref:ISL3 family transposase n=1 Tax=Streptomyces sp. NPDC000594 TaxID=3154261 RepID=UPI0033327DC0
MNKVLSQLDELLFSSVTGVSVVSVEVTDTVVRVAARTTEQQATCPACGCWSSRIHGSYLRFPRDLPAADKFVVVSLGVRRFVCAEESCSRRTFAEQVPGLTRRFGRRTERLRSTLVSVGLALAGRGRLRSARQPQHSVLVDVETHRPIDLLPDREADTLAAWLAKRPGIEIICRDRAPFFTEGATRRAPQALQIADRWHLWHNLGEAAEKCVYQHRGCLRPAPPTGAGQQEAAEPTGLSPWPTGHRFAERTRAKHATIHALLAAGHSKRSIARQLGMGQSTVLRFARAATHEALFTGQWQNRRTVLRGSPRPVGPRPPTARTVTRWILTHPDALQEPDQIQLKTVLATCPELDVLAGHVRSFARMLTQLEGHRLPEWIEAASTANLPGLQSFARHLERDLDAVTAGLSQQWNSGVVEGHVNRIKMLKRQMFGRAGFELPRESYWRNRTSPLHKKWTRAPGDLGRLPPPGTSAAPGRDRHH